MIYLFLHLVISLVITLIAIPKYSNRLVSKGIVTKDLYKKNSPTLPTQGALFVLFSSLISLSLYPFIVRIANRIFSDFSYQDLNQVDLSIIFVICLFAGYGIIDDFLDLGWYSKIIVPIFFSFPLISFIQPQVLDIPLYSNYDFSKLEISILSNYSIDISDIFKIIIIPIYVMVIANLVNMHSGFNGLQSGLSFIILSTLIIKSLLIGNFDIVVFISFAGGIFGLWYYNRYPARIFEGNIGSMTFGATIGLIIVINDFYIFGIFIFLPHIVDFLIFIISRFKEKRFRKFGKLDKEGHIISPTKYKLKFILPYYFTLREPQVVNYLHIITIIFCLIGLLIFE